MRYFIKLAYNGLAYGGWQSQPNTITVQQCLEKGLASIAGIKGSITGCGRTDAGVHASTFYAHFDHDEALATSESEQLTYRLNRYLPKDIVVFEILPVVPGAHARYSAIFREYKYQIIRQKDPFNFHCAYFMHLNLDVEAMNTCAALLIGRHDFQSFSKVNTQVNNFFCDIQKAEWTEKDHFPYFTIRADRFLRNMVRAIVGTLIDVGKGKISTKEFLKIIDSRNRSEAGYSVPAQGLTLTDIGYPENIFTDTPVYFPAESCGKTISHYYTDHEFHPPSGNKSGSDTKS